jgi:Zn-dependent peptidase ImmA (M78 family)
MAREMNRIAPQEYQILERFMSERPVRLGALARELGVKIKVSSLGPGISGQIAREEDGYTIRVNRNEARERQRFTIAHELAHFFLHRDLIDASSDGITDTVLYRSGAPQNIEYEANRLAADIVVPTDILARELQNDFGGLITENTVEALANRFEVSKAMMEVKLSNFALA